MNHDLVNCLRGHRAITLLTDGFGTPFYAKTAISLLRYRPEQILAVLDHQQAGRTAGELWGLPDPASHIPVVDQLPVESDALYLGIAPPGGQLPAAWKPVIAQAIERGLDVVSGLHDFLNVVPDWTNAAKLSGSRLVDVRHFSQPTIARGTAFTGSSFRILTVGQDCSVGKMVATLEIQRGLAARGYDARFVATGQTGIMIEGDGVPVDAVVVDFVNGAVESLINRYPDREFLLIEGQGSLAHPAYSSVSLGLLHGCQPHGLVFCLEAGRTFFKGLDPIPLNSITDQMQVCLALAQLRHPCRFLGIAVNTRNLDEAEAEQSIQQLEEQFQLPTCDVYRHGSDKLVEAAIAARDAHASSDPNR